jgi:3-deoxy-D-manno-octulosonic-acid transferase
VQLLLDAIYIAVLLLASPWLIWQSWRKGKYRQGFAEKILGRVPIRTSDRPCVWLHAVSVGEVNLLASLIDELRTRRQDVEFVISTTTMTGYAVAKSRYPAHTLFYAPLDFTWAVNEALRRIRPNLLVLAELELWPNLIAAAKQQEVKVAVVNGRMSDRSFRGYRRVRGLFAPLLRKLDCIACQTENDADRFRALGANSQAVCVTRSMKFDGAETNRNNPQTLRLKQIARITDEDVVFVAGSTQTPEEEFALTTFQQLAAAHPKLRLIIVPRHPERFEEVAKLLDQSGLKWQKRSELETRAAWPDARVLLVDRMGELRAWWGLASIAFVGGSFGDREGQNMIEPAAYGAAVSFGPRTKNFRDVVALLLASQSAKVVQNRDDLTAFVQTCLQSPSSAAELGSRAKQTVLQQVGATARTVDLLEPMLPKCNATPQERNAA